MTEQLNTYTHQWLRPGSFTAPDTGSIPGQGTKISQAMQPKNKEYTKKKKSTLIIHLRSVHLMYFAVQYNSAEHVHGME